MDQGSTPTAPIDEPAPQPTPMRPVASGGRVEVIDVLRGFALFGILLINVQAFSSPLYMGMRYAEWWPGTIDRLVEIGERFVAQGKFYTLFSILFGVGIAIQYGRAEARGQNSARFLRRRMAGLLLIGLLHGILFWYGDILTLYALVGFLLILFRNLSNRALTIWTVILLVVPVLLMGGLTVLLEVLQRLPEIGPKVQTAFDEAATQQAEGVTRALEAYSSGGLGQIVMENLRQLGMMYQFAWLMMPTFLGLFLIGFQLGRRGFFQQLHENLPLVRRWIWRMFGIGMVGNVIFVVATELSTPMIPSLTAWLAQAAASFGTLALALFYASGIILLYQSEMWRRRLSALGNVGRMALTNYLMHTLVFTTLFYSYGGGFYGKASPAVSLLLALAIYAIQIPLSRYWLARFRFGPVEWLWRSMTYGSLQPMRRTTQSTGPASGAPA